MTSNQETMGINFGEGFMRRVSLKQVWNAVFLHRVSFQQCLVGRANLPFPDSSLVQMGPCRNPGLPLFFCDRRFLRSQSIFRARKPMPRGGGLLEIQTLPPPDPRPSQTFA